MSLPITATYVKSVNGYHGVLPRERKVYNIYDVDEVRDGSNEFCLTHHTEHRDGSDVVLDATDIKLVGSTGKTVFARLGELETDAEAKSAYADLMTDGNYNLVLGVSGQ